jgi:hypothetical protein
LKIYFGEKLGFGWSEETLAFQAFSQKKEGCECGKKANGLCAARFHDRAAFTLE